MAVFEVGNRVFLEHLQNRRDLNGTIAVVMPLNEGEVRGEGRVKVTGFPRPLMVKTSNLKAVDESKHKTDWTFVDQPPMSLLELTQKTRLGLLDVCDQFVDSVFANVSQGTPVPKQPFERELAYDMFLNNSAVHCVYFCHFDMVCTDFIVEAYEGRARVFMTHVKALLTHDTRAGLHSVQTGAGTMTGYSAKEWTSPTPQPHWPDTYVEAHRRWGGGREVTRAELEKFLDLLFIAQDYSERIADNLFAQLSPAMKQAQAAWQRNRERHRGQVIITSPSALWTKMMHDNPSGVSFSTSPIGDIDIFSNAQFPGEPFTLRVPHELAVPFSNALVAISGVPLGPQSFTQCLHFQGWRTMGIPDERHPGVIHRCGWAIASVTIPH